MRMVTQINRHRWIRTYQLQGQQHGSKGNGIVALPEDQSLISGIHMVERDK